MTRPLVPTETILVDGNATAVRFRRCTMTVLEGPEKGMEVSLGKRTIRVGSAPENDLVLTDRGVSRYHCEIEALDSGYRLRDQASRNGVWLGRVRVREAILGGEVKLRLGKSTLLFAPADDSVEVTLTTADRFGEAIGGSGPMRELFDVLERVAPTDLTVLIEGETGTGKELLAEAIHHRSRRAAAPFVVVDCGSIPRDLMESELFGHVKGSFTGAIADKRGLFESAHGGTLFLDELGELDLDLQPKLLRVLERGEIRRVGASTPIPIDVRIVAATHRDILSDVTAGRFRQDLYYRLSVVKVRVPPLRERREDIPRIARALAHAIAEDYPEIGPPDLDGLVAALGSRYRDYAWPGNVRELRNVVERALHIDESGLPAGGAGLGADGAASGSAGRKPTFRVAKHEAVAKFERDFLEAILSEHGHNVSRAARAAGLDRRNFQKLLRKYDLR